MQIEFIGQKLSPQNIIQELDAGYGLPDLAPQGSWGNNELDEK